MRRAEQLGRYGQVAALAAAAALTQLALVAAGKGFLLTQLTMAGWYTLAALGLSILLGYAGQISLGHAGFFAIGGYGAAWLTTLDLLRLRDAAPLLLLARLGAVRAGLDPYGAATLTVHPWPAAALSVLFAAAVAWAIGIPVLRLRGHYLAMATLGFGTIVGSVVQATQALGAADGLAGVPPFPLPFFASLGIEGSAEHRIANYYVAWGGVALALLLLLNLIRSRMGRALRAVHGAEDAAASSGVDTARLKLATFVLSAVLAAVAGVGLTHFNGGIGPSEASAMKSVRVVAIVAVGGMGSLWGTLAASGVLNFLSLRGVFGTLDDAVFAAVLIAVMLVAPDGVLKLRLGRRARPEAAAPEPSPASKAAPSAEPSP